MSTCVKSVQMRSFFWSVFGHLSRSGRLYTNSFYNVNRPSVERGERERGKYCCVCRSLKSGSEKFNVCASCLSPYYCSKDCQRKGWAQYQSICKAIKKLKDDWKVSVCKSVVYNHGTIIRTGITCKKIPL